MSRLSLIILVLLIMDLIQPTAAQALFKPRQRDNNLLGVHILHPSELEQAAKLVNQDGQKQWGYVTIPLPATDRSLPKWQQFFLKARELKVIPIIRLVTWPQGDTWSVPSDREILYFANFLDQMPWPVQNRYVIAFNEPNHANEWGGQVNPEEYAERLNYLIDVFKSRDPQFFILPAALDRAAPDNATSMQADKYWQRVFAAQPELVDKIDGWNSHAYPNPGFVGRPNDKHKKSIVSYRYELNMLKRLGRSDIPVFITETGWSQADLSVGKVRLYWQAAWKIWQSDPSVAAVNVWLLNANDGPFARFSLMKHQQPTRLYQVIKNLPRQSGNPRVNALPPTPTPYPTWTPTPTPGPTPRARSVFDWRSYLQPFKQLLWPQASPTQVAGAAQQLSRLQIGSSQIDVEIANNPKSRQLGLGNRTFLPENQGMLFIYTYPDFHAFWMKNTLIALDMIWIKQGKVVGITANVPVESNPARPQNYYLPPTKVDWVLETNAGWAARHQVKVGDTVKLITGK